MMGMILGYTKVQTYQAIEKINVSTTHPWQTWATIPIYLPQYVPINLSSVCHESFEIHMGLVWVS
jgi:hypothetical protein